jgi:hypothetical protein
MPDDLSETGRVNESHPMKHVREMRMEQGPNRSGLPRCFERLLSLGFVTRWEHRRCCAFVHSTNSIPFRHFDTGYAQRNRRRLLAEV